MKLKYYETTQENGAIREFQQTVYFHEDIDGVENEVINIYPEITYETFEGFGGAITDSAAYIYSQLNETQKQKLIHTYFSEDEMNYRLVRIHMDSCDFSTEQYEAVSDPMDENLDTFSFARTEKYIIPMLEAANREANGRLKLMLSPWSPPAFMKTNGERSHGGKLKPEYRKRWAEIICRYIEEFQSRGYQVQRISLQNEPKAVQTWDSCIYTAEDEKEFLRDFMYPALTEHGLDDIEIFVWDHNKERVYERIRDMVDQDTDSMITGAAFHWYSGDHFESLELIQNRYPDKKLILSESCLEYSKFNEDTIDETFSKLSHEIIGDLSHGMCAFYDWNLLLDENGGPNHVGNFCHAPFLFDTRRKELMPQSTLTHFYHFSHYIRADAKRIASTKYTDCIDAVAYQNIDGRIALILLNKDDKQALPVYIRLNGQVAETRLMPGAIATCII